MNFKLFVLIFVVVAIFAIDIGYRLYVKYILKYCGKEIFSTYHPKRKYKLSVFCGKIVLILAIAVTHFTNFSLFIRIVLNCCYILADYIITREYFFTKDSGIYENGIIQRSVFIKIDDIVTFPVLNIPKEEQENYPDYTLSVATKSKGNIDLIYKDKAERDFVVRKLTEIGIVKK